MRFTRLAGSALAAILLGAGASLAVTLPASAATCTTSATNGSCGPYLDPAIYASNGFNTYDANNMWNPIAGATQTMNASTAESWNVSANMPAGNGSVVSYPETQQILTLTTGNAEPITDFTSLTSTFAETMPHNAQTIGQGAYDLWTNYTADIMVWTDNVNRCSSGSLGPDALGQATIGGQSFSVSRWGAGGEIIFSLNGAGGAGTCANESSGSVDLLGTLKWVNDHVSPITGINLVDWGFEVCSTGGAAETFTTSQFTLTANGGGPTPTPTPTTTTPTPSPTTTTPTPSPTTTTPTPTPTPTTTTPPPVPAPTGLSQTPHVLMNFSWGAVTGAASYEFQLETTAGVMAYDITEPVTHISNLEVAAKTAYQWRVQSVGGTWSAFRTFTSP